MLTTERDHTMAGGSAQRTESRTSDYKDPQPQLQLETTDRLTWKAVVWDRLLWVAMCSNAGTSIHLLSQVNAIHVG